MWNYLFEIFENKICRWCSEKRRSRWILLLYSSPNTSLVHNFLKVGWLAMKIPVHGHCFKEITRKIHINVFFTANLLLLDFYIRWRGVWQCENSWQSIKRKIWILNGIDFLKVEWLVMKIPVHGHWRCWKKREI